MNQHRRNIVVGSLACLFVATAACAAPRAAVTRGRVVYEKYCTSCHGKDGRGTTTVARTLDPPPGNLTDPVTMALVDDTKIHRLIREGKRGTAMGSWGRVLSATQLRDVARYVRSLERPRPAGMTQTEFDALVGERIYQRHCVVCHGLKGASETAIGHALPQPPQDFTDIRSMSHLSDKEMEQAIADGTPGTTMVAWKSLLSPKDIQRLVLSIRTRLEKKATHRPKR